MERAGAVMSWAGAVKAVRILARPTVLIPFLAQCSLTHSEIQALKHLFDLPIHMPTPAIIFSFGTTYTRYRIEKKTPDLFT